jgi:hypothetical protein
MLVIVKPLRLARPSAHPFDFAGNRHAWAGDWSTRPSQPRGLAQTSVQRVGFLTADPFGERDVAARVALPVDHWESAAAADELVHIRTTDPSGLSEFSLAISHIRLRKGGRAAPKESIGLPEPAERRDAILEGVSRPGFPGVSRTSGSRESTAASASSFVGRVSAFGSCSAGFG